MFKLPSLKYSYDALEPFISREIMELHHQKHHQTYTDKFNKALEEFKVYPSETAEDIVRRIVDDSSNIYWEIRNNGGGYVNHSLFFDMMSPKARREPAGELSEKINSTFTSFEDFKQKFKDAALSRFGSGWAWLVLDNFGALKIVSTPNQDYPSETPLLCLDVWEHAYYLSYKNKRGDYIDQWWNVVDWDYVIERYEHVSKHNIQKFEDFRV